MKFKENIISQWLATFVIAFLSVVLNFILGRFLGPNSYGNYSFIINVVALISIIQDGGFKNFIYRENILNTTAEKKKIYDAANLHVLFVSLIVLIFFFIINHNMFFVYLPAVIMSGLRVKTNFFSSKLKANGLFKKEAYWQASIKILTFLLIILSLILFEIKIENILWATVSSLIIMIIVFKDDIILSNLNMKYYKEICKNTFFFS